MTVSVADAVFGSNRTSPAYDTVTVWSPAATAEAVPVMTPFSVTAPAAIWVPSTVMVALPLGLCGVPTTSAVTVTSEPGAGLSVKEMTMSTLVWVVVHRELRGRRLDRGVAVVAGGVGLGAGSAVL